MIRFNSIVMVVAVMCGGVSVWGQITNGDFETGDVSGWTPTGAGPFGSPGAVTSELAREILGLVQAPGGPFWTPTVDGGTYFASLWSSDLFSGSSSLSQSFMADAGLTLSFDYFFDSSFPLVLPDSAMGVLTLPDSTMVTLFEHNTPGNLIGSDVNIDWTNVSYVLPDTGSYTLTFSTTDGFGPVGSESILGIDNVAVIPAPGAALLALIGLPMAGWFRRRAGKDPSIAAPGRDADYTDATA